MTEVLLSRREPAQEVAATTRPTRSRQPTTTTTTDSSSSSLINEQTNGASADEVTQQTYNHNHSTEEATTDNSLTRAARSPRCEAFVMTGDKMLNLNPKISPSYAKMCQDQLPQVVVGALKGMDLKKRGPFDDFPSMQQPQSQSQRRLQEESAAVPGSQSEHFLAYSGITHSESIDEDVEPNSMAGESIAPLQNNPSFIGGGGGSRLSSISSPSSPSKLPSGLHHITPIRAGSSVSSRSAELLSNPEAITRLAMRLFSLQSGFRLSDVASLLMKSNELSQRVAHQFMQLFNFSGMQLDAALREFLDHVCLVGESSERARLLVHFSSTYHAANPGLFAHTDAVHALTCALILLNTDLHGQNDGKKMTSREFVDNLNNLNNTDYSFDRTMLKSLYTSIKEQPFVYHQQQQPDHHRKSNGSVRVNRAASMAITGKGGNSLINPEEAIDYKHGWLLRKSVHDCDGKRTPFGRRRWQMYYATIRGMVLYLHKNENVGFSGKRYEIFNNCILLHHAMAEVPKDYTKRQHVFKLRTAHFGEQLFQTSDDSELNKWIQAINYVSAAFSTPALHAPVSSNKDVPFYKPLLPSTPTTLSVADQLRAHQSHLEEMTDRLAKLRENAPSLKAKGRTIYDYFYKERYLDKERERYAIYVEVLSEKLCTASLSEATSNQAAAARRHGC